MKMNSTLAVFRCRCVQRPESHSAALPLNLLLSPWLLRVALAPLQVTLHLPGMDRSPHPCGWLACLQKTRTLQETTRIVTMETRTP